MTWPTRRGWRLGSGLVLFTYVALHLANHALGLVSVDAAEAMLATMVAFWQSVPGTLLLYGAVAVHVSLALAALYLRRTLRMPPLEVLRIALGLGIPLLLIGHAVNTRIAWESFALAPDYHRIVWGLWTSDSEGRQLALLVPGWLHGCLGVNFAFGRRPLYQRLRPVLFALALLLPVTSALGFLAMGRELAADPLLRGWLDAHGEAAPATRIALARLRDGLVAAWFALIGAIFVAREWRAVRERRRNAVVTIAYPARNARVPRGWSVLEASRSHHIPHLSVCAGQARCSTCRVRVLYGEQHCPPPSPVEQATLARIGAADDVRLACQLRPTGDIGVRPLLAVSAAAPSADIVEGRFAVVHARWSNRGAYAADHLPHDVVYLSERFADTATAALTARGGMRVGSDGATVSAAFDAGNDGADAARNAVAVALATSDALGALARRYAREFGVAPRFRVLVHVGAGALGGLQERPGNAIAAGPVFAALDELDAALPDADGVLVTEDAALAAGVAAATWRDVATAGRGHRLAMLRAPAPAPAATG